jgi:hypothetical protein
VLDCAPLPLFRFSQIDVPWPLGPPDGRYLVRPPGAAPEDPPSHVVLFTTLGAPVRPLDRRRAHRAPPQSDPSPVSIGRATVIGVQRPLGSPADAERWLRAAGEEELGEDLAVLNRALHAFRLVTADPRLHTIGRRQLLATRLGYGAGEQVADGHWSAAVTLTQRLPRIPRARVLEPQARLAAALGRREPPLACAELALRAALDLEEGRPREAALQVLVALDAALAELSLDPLAHALGARVEELRAQREAVVAAAQAALGGEPDERQQQAVAFTLERLEAALRARAVAGAG